MDDVVICGGCGGAGDQIGRRQFLSKTALAAVTLALAACASGDATGPSLGGGNSSIKISDYPALANVNGVAMFTLGGEPLAVVRTGASSFVALSRICPHMGGLIGQASFGFMCPVHGAEFNTTGQWIGGQRTSSMRSYSTSFDATTGTLTIA